MIDDNYISKSNDLLFYVFLPVFLFTKISSSHIKEVINFKLVIGYYIVVIMTFIISYLFVSIKKYPTSIRGTFIQGTFRGNIGYIGLAIIMSAYGEHALFIASILLGFSTIIINFLSIIAFIIYGKNKNIKNNYSIIKDVVLNPIIISSIFGIIFNILNISIPSILKTSFDYMSNITLPLALFTIGASFKRPAFNNKLTIPIYCNLIKLIIMPATAFIIFYILDIKGIELYIGLIFAAAPTAVVTYVFASHFKGDIDLASMIVATSVIFSFFTYPLLFQLFEILGHI